MAKLFLLATLLTSSVHAAEQQQQPSWHRFATNINYRLTAIIDVNGGTSSFTHANVGARNQNDDVADNTAEHAERSEGYSIPIDVLTLYDPTTDSYHQRINYYSGTYIEYNINGEGYAIIPKPYRYNAFGDEAYRKENGWDATKASDQGESSAANVCLYDVSNETHKEPYLNFFPTVRQMENYSEGKLVTDEAGIPYRVATLHSSHDTYNPISPSSEQMPDGYQNGMPTQDYFELLYQESLSTGAVTGSNTYARPLKWTMLGRNQVIDAHTDHWAIRYLNYEPIDSAEEKELWNDWLTLIFDSDCPDDSSFEIGEYHELKMNRLGLFFSSSGRDPLPGKTQNSQFDAFMTRYNKQYSTEEEYHYRKSIHDTNVGRIQQWNEMHAGRTSFVPNQHMDLETEEVLKYRGGHIPIPHLDEAKKRAAAARSGQSGNLRRLQGDVDDIENYNWTVYQVPEDFDPESVPREFDWRIHLPGSVSPIKDQGFCGSCWAFSFISALESHWFITNSQSVILPEQFVIDCLWTDESFACDGGQSYVAAIAALRRFGGMVPAHNSYGSYLSVDGQCYVDILQGLGMLHGRSKDQQSMLTQTTLQPATVQFTDWITIPYRDEVAVKHALMTKGPLSVIFNAVDESLYYSSGVIDVESCTANGYDDMNHVINLVGWGVDNLEDGTEAQHWILRNSWSQWWGDRGYFRVRMGKRDCGVTTDAGFPLVEQIRKETDVAV